MKRAFSMRLPHGTLHGDLDLPESARGLILLVRSHHVAVDGIIAANFRAHGYAIFSMELLSTQETQFPDATQNVPRLTQRLLDVLDLIRRDGDMEALPLAIFATGDTSPAAIRAAAQRDTQVQAIACQGGIIDRAGLQALKYLLAPLLMLFDADDEIGPVAAQRAAAHLSVEHEIHGLEIGEDALVRVAEWFSAHLAR